MEFKALKAKEIKKLPYLVNICYPNGTFWEGYAAELPYNSEHNSVKDLYDKSRFLAVYTAESYGRKLSYRNGESRYAYKKSKPKLINVAYITSIEIL